MEIKEVPHRHTRFALPAYYIIAPAEASSNLARYDGMRFGLRVDGEALNDVLRGHTRAQGFWPKCSAVVLIGTYVLSYTATMTPTT